MCIRDRLNKARQDVRQFGNAPVPKHLKNPVTGLMKQEGYGDGYKYSHDYPDHFAAMENLPERLRGHRYYTPSNQGYEQSVADRIQRWWGDKKGGTIEPPGG